MNRKNILIDTDTTHEIDAQTLSSIKSYVKKHHGAEYNHFVDTLYHDYTAGKFPNHASVFAYLDLLNDDLTTRHAFLVNPEDIKDAMGIDENSYRQVENTLLLPLGTLSGVYVHHKYLLEKHGVQSLDQCHLSVSQNPFEFLIYNECVMRNLHNTEGKYFMKPGYKKAPKKIGNKGGGIIKAIRKFTKQVAQALQK